MKKTIFLTCTLIFHLGFSDAIAQSANDRPKLVLGIVIDQMRGDYVYRYYDKFGEDGFRRFFNEGFVLKNAHYSFLPTKTGPGHASIYSGTTPSNHGIIGNEWYRKAEKSVVDCVVDPTHRIIGSRSSMQASSPRNLLATTIGDALKLSTNMKSKVISVAMKDRGAVIPGGHMADGAYWYDAIFGIFISSTYYSDTLPPWVEEFNKKYLAHTYLNQTWNTLLPIGEYTESQPDGSPYETQIPGKGPTIFPYDLSVMRRSGGFTILPITPFANTLTCDMAKAAIAGEDLGQDDVTDLLAISFSAPDLAGHNFGPYSVEIEDMYLRLDSDLADLFAFLDAEVGKDEYLVFLSSDHGVADVPQFNIDNRLPGGYFQLTQDDFTALNTMLDEKFGRGSWLESISNDQIFLNEAFISSKKIDVGQVEQVVADAMSKYDGITHAFTTDELRNASFSDPGILGGIARGYHPERSGNVAFNLKSGYITWAQRSGSTHGSYNNYDTHVPIMFFGWKVPKGESVRKYHVSDIAPTISMKLNIQLPSMSTGNPVEELFRN